MGITTGGGVAFDSGANVRDLGKSIAGQVDRLQQESQFKRQKALEAGIQKYYQFEKERASFVDGGGDPTLFTQKNAGILAEIQSDFSTAVGKPLSPEQAQEFGFGALQQFLAKYQPAQSQIHAEMQYRPAGGAGAGDPGRAPPVASRTAGESSGPPQGAATEFPVTPHVAPTGVVPNESSIDFSRPGDAAQVLKETEATDLANYYTAIEEFREKFKGHAPTVLFSDDSIRDGFKNKSGPLWDYYLEFGKRASSSDMRGQDSAPDPGETYGGYRPDRSSVPPASGSVKPNPLTPRDPKDTDPLSRAPVSRPLTFGAQGDPQAQTTNRMEGLGRKEGSSGVLAQLDREAASAATPQKQREYSKIDKFFEEANAVYPDAQVVEKRAASGRPPVTMGEAQRAIRPAKAVIKMRADELAEMPPEKQAEIRRLTGEYIKNLDPVELEAMGMSKVAARRETMRLAEIQASATVMAAEARAGSEAAAAAYKYSGECYERAMEAFELVQGIADKQFKGDMTKALDSNKALQKIIEYNLTGALGAQVDLDTFIDNRWWYERVLTSDFWKPRTSLDIKTRSTAPSSGEAKKSLVDEYSGKK